MLMKKITCLLIVFVVASLTLAHPISEKEARQVAKTFIAYKTADTSSLNLTLEEVKINGTTPIFYRFQWENKGFVIVSGSSFTTPILAYSTTHLFEKNPAVSYFLERFEKEILDIEKRGDENSTKDSRWNDLLYMKKELNHNHREIGVGPLLTTTWNQSQYYNTYCPWDAHAGAYYDYRVPNGCVALAMAMILNYYQYPQSGSGGVSYIPHGYPRQTVVFSQQHYYYPAMHDQPNFYSNEMAKLIYHCGVAVKMHYDYTGSGATEMEARTQFINVFKYHSGAQLNGPAMFPNWGEALKQQLDNRYPLFYTAYNGVGGHAFVVDGYDENMLFHVNWGWGGSANGFYHITNLDPFDAGYPYNSNETAIFNLYPAQNFPAQCSGHQRITASFGTITNGSAQQRYAPNSDCSWMIAVKDATHYVFDFSKIDTEDGEDFITIYAGPTRTSEIAGKFSGTTIPERVSISNVDSVLITFTSNGNNEGRGFTIRYFTMLESPYCNAITTLTSANGSISDNSQDNEYRSESLCTWLIQPPYAGSFVCSFPNFDLKSGDFVDIYNNTTTPPTFVDRFDANNIPTENKTYPFSKMKVVFVADNWDNGNGFTMNWSANIVGINEAGISDLQLYPNPIKDFVHFSLTTDNSYPIRCAITDCTGKQIFTRDFIPNNNSIDERIILTSVAKGIYFFELQSSTGKLVRKLIVE